MVSPSPGRRALAERLGAQRGDEVPGRMFPIDKRQNMTDLNDINLYIYISI